MSSNPSDIAKRLLLQDEVGIFTASAMGSEIVSYREAAATITALRERNAELASCCRDAKEWLQGWASAEPYLSRINLALASGKDGE